MGLSGGLALFCKSDIKIEVHKSSLSHIDAVVEEGDRFDPWWLTGFYENPDTSLQINSWNFLKDSSTASQLPWVVVGDFNEISCSMEKEGGAPRPNYQMARFNNAINFCGLRDVGFIGPKFTWLYQRRDGTQIRARLDRALASQEWFLLFPTARLFHKSSSVSNHSPLLLQFLGKPKRGKKKKLFYFNFIWLSDARCE